MHSLHAYFIRRGDDAEPMRYEVDRIRNGRSFCTRRVVARQAVGAILNLEASLQAPEEAADIETVSIPPDVPRPRRARRRSRGARCSSARSSLRAPRPRQPQRRRSGRCLDAGRPTTSVPTTRVHQGGLAYLSDDLPTDAVVRAHPMGRRADGRVVQQVLFSASLDHAIWFHRPLRADQWHLHDFTCQTYVGGRGLAIGHVFDADGVHVATIAQEVLLRDSRGR